jgi:glucose-6-phosphate 1-dehydrogenase
MKDKPTQGDQQHPPTLLVIFGASGDLTLRKIVPALFDLALKQMLPEKLSIVGVVRSRLSKAKLREQLKAGVAQSGERKPETRAWKAFANHITYSRGDYEQHKTYQTLARKIATLERQWDGEADRIFYLTITVAEELGMGHRGSYFDRAGTLRDMVQNHLMQLFCLVAMEPVISFDADEVRNKKLDVLRFRNLDPLPRGAAPGVSPGGTSGMATGPPHLPPAAGPGASPASAGQTAGTGNSSAQREPAIQLRPGIQDLNARCL